MAQGRPMLNWAMIPTGIALVSLLLLTLLGRSGSAPEAGARLGGRDAGTAHPAAAQARQFFGWAGSVGWNPLTNTANPFFTLAIQPPPPPPPPAKPPATRKVDVVYRGYFETSARVRRAVVQVADKELLVGRGDSILEGFAVAEIEMGHLGVTNGAGTAVKLEFSKGASIEVPAK